MNNKLHLVIWGVTTALVASNIIIGKSYINDSTQYQNTINQQTKLIEKYKKVNGEDQELINQQSIEINKEKDELTKQQSNINNINKQLNQIKEENDKLKKAYHERKKVIKQSKHIINKPKVNKAKTNQSNNNPKLNIIITSYTSSCSGCTGVTATGLNVNNGTTYNGYRIIAASPSIPLYSIVRISTNTDSFDAIVMDRGGAIQGNKIDLLVSTYQEAMDFGKQNATLTILREGKG